MLEKFLKATFFVGLYSILLTSILFGESSRIDALTSPLAGKPLSFDKMLPYLSEGQPIYRGGRGDLGEIPIEIVIDPSNDNQNEKAQNGEQIKESS